MPIVTHGPIVGATTTRTVTIWVRADGPCQAEIRLARDPDLLPATYSFSTIVQLKADQDFSGVVTLDGLKPDTRYHYALLLDGIKVLPDADYHILSFRTFPEHNSMNESFSFAFGSCFIPQDYGDKIFSNLLPAEEVPEPRFFLMLGDNIYADNYIERYVAGGQQVARQNLLQLYRAAYKDSWGYPTFRRALMSTPAFMIFDDHEFWNNWGNEAAHHFERDGFPAAARAYWEYQDSHNPDAAQRHGLSPAQYYYTFSYGDIGFFVLDCRTRRNPSAIPYRTMLGSEQREALIDWLVDNNERYRLKFIVSSVPLSFIVLPRWIINLLHGGLGDQWLGYPEERRLLFHVIQQEKINGVHFLSGDIHLGQGVKIESQNDEDPPVYSYTSSPLANTFLIIANEAPWWASAVSGGLLGAAAGLVVGLFYSQISIPAGLLLGLLIGGIGAELLRRFLDSRRPPYERKEPGMIGKFLYKMFSNLAQQTYLRRVFGVAGDEIQGAGLHYQSENLFPPVDGINMGLVTVTHSGKEINVQFTLLDEDGKPWRVEKAGHTV